VFLMGFAESWTPGPHYGQPQGRAGSKVEIHTQ
jgi:hypothetical protein